MSKAVAALYRRSTERRARLFLVALVIAIVFELLNFSGAFPGPFEEPWTYLRTDNPVQSSGFLGAFLVFCATRPSLRRLLAIIAVGGGADVALAMTRLSLGQSTVGALLNVGPGVGLAALTSMFYDAWRASPGERAEPLEALTGAAIFPCFLLVSRGLMVITVLAHPSTFDPSLFAVDSSLGRAPSPALGALLVAHLSLGVLVSIVYVQLASGCVVVYAAQRRRCPQMDLLNAFVVAGLIGWALIHVVPACGPRYAFHFPSGMPDPAGLPLTERADSMAPRNCVPSLHTVWALLMVWHARPLGRAIRAFAWTWFALTIVALLGTGEHYFIDVLASIPLAVGVHALTTLTVPWRRVERWAPVVLSGCYVVAWSLVLRAGTRFFVRHPIVAWPIAFASVVPPLVLERRLWRVARQTVATPESALAALELCPPPRPTMPARGRLLVAVFGLAGFAGIACDLLLEKQIAAAVGTSPESPGIAVGVVLSGVALGSWLGARAPARSPIKAFAVAQLAIGLAVFASPLFVLGAAHVFVSITAHLASAAALSLARVAVFTCVLVLPAIFAGMTWPLIIDAFGPGMPLGPTFAAFAGAYFAGGALAAPFVGDFAVPFLGVFRSTLLVGVVFLALALVALRLDAAARANREGEPSSSASAANTGERATSLSAALLGALAFIAAPAYSRLVATTVGTSLSAEMAAVLAIGAGLAAGAFVGRVWLVRAFSTRDGAAFSVIAFGGAMVFGARSFAVVPSYFAEFAGFAPTNTFGTRELVRVLVAAALAAPPAFFAGGALLFVLGAVGGPVTPPRRIVARLVTGAALGGAAGVALGARVLVPLAGDLAAVTIAGALALALGVALASSLTRRPRALALAVAVAGALAVELPMGNAAYAPIVAGTNVYFETSNGGAVVDRADGDDLAAVVERGSTSARLLVVDGVIRGGEGDSSEGASAPGTTALVPLAHTAARGRALAVGFGVGESTRILCDAGFAAVDVVDADAAAVSLAARCFSSEDLFKNGGHVSLRAIAARAFVAGAGAAYDVVVVDGAPLWTEEGAELYAREFYDAVASRLAADGVFAQRLDLARLEYEDLATAFATLRAAFPHVWLYVFGDHGVTVACAGDCSPTEETLAAIDRIARSATGLNAFRGGAIDLLRYRALEPAGLDRFLAMSRAAGGPAEDRMATDDNLYFAVRGPRANVRPYGATLFSNLATLAAFGPKSAVEGTRIMSPR